MDAVLGTIHTEPGMTLLGGHGQESFIWSQSLSTIASTSYGQVLWRNDKTGKKFGVKIAAPFQMFTAGSAPYYQTKTNDEDWKGEHRSEVFNFDSSALGFNVVVHPVATHTTLGVTVTISDSS